MTVAALIVALAAGIWWVIGSLGGSKADGKRPVLAARPAVPLPVSRKGRKGRAISEETSQFPPEEMSQWERGFSLNIVGESHYQSAVKRCSEGEAARLIREPDNPHDAMAVRVESKRGAVIGYLARDRAEWIGGQMDEGWRVDARIERVTGEGRASRGILLRMRLIEPSRS